MCITKKKAEVGTRRIDTSHNQSKLAPVINVVQETPLEISDADEVTQVEVVSTQILP
eukprot:UN18540